MLYYKQREIVKHMTQWSSKVMHIEAFIALDTMLLNIYTK